MNRKVLGIFAVFVWSLLIVGCTINRPTGPIGPVTLVEVATVTAVTEVVENTAVPPTSTASPTEADVKEGSSMANADVLFVEARETAVGLWTFSVEVAHPDTGWEDYADGWDVLLPDGSVIKPDSGSPFTRLLVHPHENEQPFTRSQSNISIPAEVTTVTVRAHDLVDGFGGQEVVVDLTAVSGENFSVTRLEQ
ncbi:hypothetical protein MNBD_CHLOROFLEXI01-4686 [hydrothermal vent metagenome]|uniref:Uncharacterized protein n=1 Tax=hydrothermal vent metagenome TaxID=652676 RepID=A0A3B0V5J1_9ZZZZ